MSAASEVSRRSGLLEQLALVARSMRPRQWPKNGAVLLALVFALQLGQPEKALRAVAAALLFCLLSGAVYLVNDLRDAEKDRLHPRKRLRPVASGRLSPALAAASAGALVLVTLVSGFALSTGLGWAMGGYLLLQALYVAVLKHVVILDVLALAMGFVIRAAAGAVVVGVPISPWLYFCALLLALFLALGKRRQEIVALTASDQSADLAQRHRPALEQYSLGLLDQLIQVVTTCLVLAYSLYTFSAEYLPPNHTMMLTVPFVLYGLFRYLYLVHVRGEGGAPEEVLLRDPGIAVCVTLWGAAVVAVLYFSPRGL